MSRGDWAVLTCEQGFSRFSGFNYTYGNCQVVAASQLRDLTDVPERRAHDNGLVAVFLVVFENLLHALDTGSS